MRKQLLLICCVLLLAGSGKQVFASSADDLKVHDETEEMSQSIDSQIHTLFRDAVAAISKNNTARASEALVEIRILASKHRYNDIPDFSFDLIRRAKESTSKDMKGFLYDHAQRLSPNHPGVHLSLATAHGDLGFRKSSRFLLGSLNTMKDYPVTFAATAARAYVALVCAVFVTVFLVTFLFLVSRSGELYIAVATLFSKKTRGVFAVLIFPALIVLPLMLPFLLTLCLWGLMIPLLLKRLVWIPLFTAGLVFSLIFGIPFAQEVISLSERNTSKALESVINRNYMPGIQEYLDSVIENDRMNPMYPVFLGQVQQEQGDLESAKSAYEMAMPLVRSSSSLSYLIKHNMGVYAFQKGDIEQAYSEWRELYDQGWTRFELLYNLSIASLSLFKRDAYEEYYSGLLAKYPEQSKRIFEAQGEIPEPILGKLPTSFFVDVYKDALGVSRAETEGMSVLYSSLFFPESGQFVNQELYQMSGVLLLLVWFFLAIPRRVSYRYRGSLVSQRVFFAARQSRSWKLIPFGWCLVDGWDLYFLCMGTLVLFLVLLALGAPFPVAYEPVDGGLLVLLLPAVVVLLVSTRPSSSKKKRGVS
jgi:hypothetical protein